MNNLQVIMHARLHPQNGWVQMRAELSAALGYMRNARIDLETGASKATAIRTISGGIKRAEEALAKIDAALGEGV